MSIDKCPLAIAKSRAARGRDLHPELVVFSELIVAFRTCNLKKMLKYVRLYSESG